MVQNNLSFDHDTHNSNINSNINSSTRDDRMTNEEQTFPVKLFNMLEFIRLHDDPHLATMISWESHGKGFRVHDPEKAEETILPRFFNVRRYSSFHRQLNLWGFTRLARSQRREGLHYIEEDNKSSCSISSSSSSNDGSFYYYHEMFQRNKAFLCQNIRRSLRLTSFNLTSTIKRQRMVPHHVISTISSTESPAIAKKDQDNGDRAKKNHGPISPTSSHSHPRCLESSTKLAYVERNIVHSNAMGTSNRRRESMPSLLGRSSLTENLMLVSDDAAAEEETISSSFINTSTISSTRRRTAEQQRGGRNQRRKIDRSSSLSDISPWFVGTTDLQQHCTTKHIKYYILHIITNPVYILNLSFLDWSKVHKND